MSLGGRRTLHMMWGELIGVGLVSVLSMVGVAAVMLNDPTLFSVFKYVGGAYLVWLGIQMWQAKGKMAIPADLSVGPAPGPGLIATMRGRHSRNWASCLRCCSASCDSS